MESEDLKPPIWLDRPGGLARAAANLAACSVLAVDTESNSLYAYQEQVCLIQFSTPSQDFLIDPLAIQDLSVLEPIFSNPDIEKTFHAAEYDLICLKRDFGFRFNNLFDTMIAGRILGRQVVGLSGMLEEEFGIVLDKRYQRADWGQRPLPPAQLAYARLDTHYLLALRDRLKEQLIVAGRWEMAQEDFQRMCHVNGNARSEEDGLDACWRIPGVQDLDPQRVAVLQLLCQFRDAHARILNRPAFKVMSNQVLLEIARACPLTFQELAEIPGLSERQGQRYGREILKTVQEGLASPPLVKPSNPRPDERFLLRLEALRAWRKHTAQQIGVESDVILPRDVMFAIAEANPRSGGELRAVMELLPWRLERYGDQILKAIHSR
ncbi:MAG TPA: HRDC domain-containing protein [Anaerolineaceae bacterium]|nr:HRDC domain-containing protein [Anaerolineaceae bacterium]